MAATVEGLSKLVLDLTCPLCLSIYTDPVELQCEHYFCRGCITKHWEQQGELSCAICSDVSPSSTLKSNRKLSNVVATVCKEHARLEENVPSQHTCPEHQRKMERFCVTDCEVICLDCRDSRRHLHHDVLNVQEAAEEFKAQLQKSVTKLQTLIEKRNIAKSKYESLLEEILNSTQNIVDSIKKSFEELHSFLYKEESALLQQLKEEVNQQSSQLQRQIDQIPRDLSSLDANIKAMEEEIRQEDCISFLLNLKETQKRAKICVPPLENIAVKVKPENYLGPLQYWTWKNMFKILDPGLSNLTFNPATACSHLSLCGPTRVRYSDKVKVVPDSPERFNVAAFILGSDGFTSGKHYWQVDVGDGKDWSLGVAKESINRKGDLRQSPKHGYWTIYREKDTFGAFLFHPKTIEARGNPTRIGVYLDYEGGRVSFYDADLCSHLFTFHATFSEKLYPFFYPGLKVTKSNNGMLRIQHLYL
ncbi:zinc-binding protein A33-like [Scyliorhinus canicula]|uniref:zinc-binding protein A33-like n=1 Tax=Scyliorhinus canicula TaxID=7830 RepID=UPI0018F60E68|nr:zinc-binding protein A33-like [Scyliorhinus canicula]